MPKSHVVKLKVQERLGSDQFVRRGRYSVRELKRARVLLAVDRDACTDEDAAAFVKGIVDAPRYKDAQRIVLVMDQLNILSTVSLYEAFAPAEPKRIADGLEVHHTPKHGSWLNVAEVELSVLGKRLRERVGPGKPHRRLRRVRTRSKTAPSVASTGASPLQMRE